MHGGKKQWDEGWCHDGFTLSIHVILLIIVFFFITYWLNILTAKIMDGNGGGFGVSRPHPNPTLFIQNIFYTCPILPNLTFFFKVSYLH